MRRDGCSRTEFRVLGPLQVSVAGTLLPLGGSRQEAILAALLLAGGRPVSVSMLGRVAGEDLDRDGLRRRIQNRVSALRQVLARGGAESVIVREGAGYRLRIAPEQFDATLFADLAGQARASAEAGDPVTAARLFRRALDLWRGPALDGLDHGPLHSEVAGLDETRLAAWEDCLELEMATGAAAPLIAELRTLVGRHPLRQRLVGLLMNALHREGQQAEALAAYRDMASYLRENHGLDPAPELRTLHDTLLRAGPAPVPVTQSATTMTTPAQRPRVHRRTTQPRGDNRSTAEHAQLRPPSMPPERSPAPAQLPPDVPGFTGRVLALAKLDTVVGTDAAPRSTVVISAIAGTAGVGKTALAVRWAHRVRHRFTDGQLYLDLRGFDPDQPVSATDALAGFLRALGVSDPDIPTTEVERTARFRTQMSGRRMLVVLDNAASVEQVRPLLPGSEGCVVVVTSRDSLAGLVARDGAFRIDLDLLPQDEAVALLRTLIGSRVDDDAHAANALADRCARLPLALRVAAELAVSRPHSALREVVADLGDQQRQVELLNADGDPRSAVFSVFSWSVRHLEPDAARLFRLLGGVPGPSFDAYVAAALLGDELPSARRALDALARAHLVHPTRDGRHGMHDLLRSYAFGLTAQDPDETRTARNRLLDYYLGTAAWAMNTLYPAEIGRRPRIIPPATPAPAFSDGDAARAWLDNERSCLVATATADRPAHTIRLSATLFRYLYSGYNSEAEILHRNAAQAARECGDVAGQAAALNALGTTRAQVSRVDDAIADVTAAIAMFRRAGERAGEGRAVANLGSIHSRQERHGVAAEHYQNSLIIFSEVGDRVGVASSLANLGHSQLRISRYAQGVENLERATAMFHELNHPDGEAQSLAMLGLALAYSGQHRAAAERLDKSFALFNRLGNRFGEAWALDDIGITRTLAGSPDEAGEYHSRALAMFVTMGDEEGRASALNGLGEAANAAGRSTDALTHHTDALAIATSIGIRYQQARAHTGLSRAHRALLAPHHARAHHQHATELYSKLGVREARSVSEPDATGECT